MTPRDYALLAQAAYTAQPDVGAEDGSARVIFSATSDGLVASIPGTNNFECWRTDLDALMLSVPGLGTVHRGFYNAIVGIWPMLKGCKAPDVLCGHSEGASLAGIYAGLLCLVGTPPKAIYGYEPAKVSVDSILADLLLKNNVQVYLTQKGHDLVPFLPVELYIERWQHYGKLTSIGTPLLPFPNVKDHLIENVIAAYPA